MAPPIMKISLGKSGETFDTDHRFMPPLLHASPFVMLGDPKAVTDASPEQPAACEVVR
jgi:hypothetical protein